jgi:hypothetical protein
VSRGERSESSNGTVMAPEERSQRTLAPGCSDRLARRSGRTASKWQSIVVTRLSCADSRHPPAFWVRTSSLVDRRGPGDFDSSGHRVREAAPWFCCTALGTSSSSAPFILVSDWTNSVKNGWPLTVRLVGVYIVFTSARVNARAVRSRTENHRMDAPAQSAATRAGTPRDRALFLGREELPVQIHSDDPKLPPA